MSEARLSEGSWSIGLFRGPSLLELSPIEAWTPQPATQAAWPPANPILTCASVHDAPSNFVADPFPYISPNGTWYVFYETKTNANMQGDIAASYSTDEGASWTSAGVVLDEPWHLSYPFVFSHANRTYMLPEGTGGGETWLYESDPGAFPRGWRRARRLVEGVGLVDPVLFEHAGRWWLLGSDPREPLSRGEYSLSLWHAAGPLQAFAPHVSNPVLRRPLSGAARNGGAVIRLESGELVRFGQDCGETYGHAVRAFRIKELSERAYAEEAVPESEFQLNAQASRKGDAAWHGVRRHHFAAVPLSDGTWLAAVDGDAQASSPLSVEALRQAGRAARIWGLSLTVWAIWTVWATARRRLRKGAVSPEPSLLRLGDGPVVRRAPSSVFLSQARQSPRERRASSFAGETEHLRPPHPLLPLELAHRARGSMGWVDGCGPASCAPSPRLPPRRRLLLALLLATLVCFLLAPLLARATARVYMRGILEPGSKLGRPPAQAAERVRGRASIFTLAIMSYGPRARALELSLRHYARCPSVHEVLLVWNGGEEHGRLPASLADVVADLPVPVRVRHEDANSLNNRFKPDELLATRAVFFVDDDMLFPCADVEAAFGVWRTKPSSLVGFFPRRVQPLHYEGEYAVVREASFNALLTGGLFMDAPRWFAAYSAPLLAPLRDYVDRRRNCEDVLLNYVVAAGGGAAPFWVRPRRRLDLGALLSTPAVSHGAQQHARARGECAAVFARHFGFEAPADVRVTWPDWRGMTAPWCWIRGLGCLYL